MPLRTYLFALKIKRPIITNKSTQSRSHRLYIRRFNKHKNRLFTPSNYQKLIMNIFYTILLLLASNVFMTLAWYGHLKLQQTGFFTSATPLVFVILLSWGVAFFEYCLQVPANRIGFEGNGGPFSLMQLKVIQEVITLVVFIV